MTNEQRRVVVTLGFCGFVSAADNWFVSPALPAIAQALSVLPSAAAVILSAYLVPYGLLQPVCGAVGDRVGRVRLLRVIVMGLALATAGCALAPTLGTLVTARIITGCFAAGIISVSQALVGDVVSARERSGAVGLLMGITFAGQGASAGLGGIVADLVGWRAAFICFGMLGLIAWMGLQRLPRNFEPRVKTDVVDAALPDAVDDQSDGVGSRSAFALGAFLCGACRTFFGRGRAVFLAACSTGIIYLGIYGFMGTFLAERCGLSSAQAGLVMMFYGVACLGCGSLSGRIAARGGQMRVIMAGEVSGLSAIALLAATLATGSWPFALGAAACLGAGYIWVQPTLVALSMDADSTQTGLCTGLVGLGVFAGGGVGSAAGQLLLASGGYALLFAVAACALTAQLIIGAHALGTFVAARDARR